MWIKICGITSPEDGLLVRNCGADAIGLNFFRGSKRCVDQSTARTIRDTAADGIDIVGVFVNATTEEICDTVDAVGLTAVQFHGDESPDTIALVQSRLPHAKLIKAFRVGSEEGDFINRELGRLDEADVRLTAILVDAFVPGEYGGTGHRVSSAQLQLPDRQHWPPLILAGGLTPDNVAAAVSEIQPWGVDTASGVELSPGRKSKEKVRRFVNSIRKTL